jgi:predicted PolB exonuclease-like 3'-5' exonuclease
MLAVQNGSAVPSSEGCRRAFFVERNLAVKEYLYCAAQKLHKKSGGGIVK